MAYNGSLYVRKKSVSLPIMLFYSKKFVSVPYKTMEIQNLKRSYSYSPCLIAMLYHIDFTSVKDLELLLFLSAY